MRICILAFVLAACSPEIPSGSYRCGPDQACPEGQLCNGPDNTCVQASTAQPFACLPKQEHEPDNAPAMATDMGAFACVSNVYTFDGCLAPGDTQDWFKLTTPAGCTAIQAEVRISYPISYETLGVQLGDAGGAKMTDDVACKTQSGGLADDDRCITQPITGSTTYTIEVKPAGGGDCDGACNYNRYTLSVQVTTPG